MTISPVSPDEGDSIAHDGDLRPGAGPTDPALRWPGGSGLLHIWCAASVMPYDSSTGTPKVSSSCRTGGGRGDDDERISRRRFPSRSAAYRLGQDGLVNRRYGRVPRRPEFLQPAEKTGRVEAWRADQAGARGHGGQRRADQAMDMEQRHDIEAAVAGGECQRRPDVSCRGRHVPVGQWTRLGRAVVPDVCRTRATSSSPASPCDSGAGPSGPSR